MSVVTFLAALLLALWLLVICSAALFVLGLAGWVWQWLRYSTSAHRHCCIVIGAWMLRDWHLYRYTKHRSAKQPDRVQWHMWDRVL